MVGATHLIIIEGTVCRLAMNLQRCLGLTDCISAAVTALLLKAGTTGFMRHGSLAALHENIVFGAFFVCVVHTVYDIAI